MKQLFIDQSNALTLDAQFVNKAGIIIALAIIGEDGNALKDSTGAAISGWTNDTGAPAELQKVTFDTDLKKYKAVFSFATGTKPQYIRAFWYAKEGTTAIDLPGYLPEEIQLVTASPSASAQPQVLPLSLFESVFLAQDFKMDDDFKEGIRLLMSKNRSEVERELLAAQGRIELKLKMRLFATKDKMDRDYYAEEFRQNYWLQQTNFKPIISVDSYKLIYGSKEILVTPDIHDMMVVNKKMGTIEFLPTAFSGTLFSMMINNVSALGITIMQTGGWSRVPLLFRIEYTHGLDFPNLEASQKEAIRHAVGRNALIELLPRIDPLLRTTSESMSIDGASSSESSGAKDIIKAFREEETAFVDELKREYGMHFDMVVV